MAIEIKIMWQLDNVVIVPIIIGATGLIHKQFLNDTNKLDVKLNISEMQKAVLLEHLILLDAFSHKTVSEIISRVPNNNPLPIVKF